jgi:hypothetical protein
VRITDLVVNTGTYSGLSLAPIHVHQQLTGRHPSQVPPRRLTCTDDICGKRRLPALAGAEEERTIKWESVLLLGTDKTMVVARAWHESVTRLQRIASVVEARMTWAQAVTAASKA